MNQPSIFDDPNGVADDAAPERHPHKGRAKRRRFRGCLPMLLVLALLAGGAWWSYGYVSDQVRGWFQDSAADFDGSSMGAEVYFEVASGQSWPSMGQELESLGVVASSEAFTKAARSAPEEQTRRLQPGVYELRERMKAADVVDVLVEPNNIIHNTVTIPEGLRVVDIVEKLAEETEFDAVEFEEVLANPEQIGLPDYATGNPEGYLFPATYRISPSDTPETILQAMVKRWEQAARESGLEQSAADLGYTPHELMTIAAMIQAEGRGDDMPKVARVLYNRLEGPGNRQGTNGLLQIDATINYALDRRGTITVTRAETQTESPYNTYKYPGLPPGPIMSPGDDAIDAAANPADGDWYFYVTVNLATGETKFAETYAEHLRYVEEYREYCRTQSERC
jgi:UPF0755 protein